MQKQQRAHWCRGFTLIEALVAVAILTASISGYLSLSRMSLSATSLAKDRMVASYLAQDAMEYIKMVQQENFMLNDGSLDWLRDIRNCESSDGSATCIIDSRCHNGFNGNSCEVSGNLAVDCAGTCPRIKRNVQNGLYGYGEGANWVETKFRRTISMEEMVLLGDEDHKDEASVSVIVSWERNGRTHQVEARHSMFNIN